jgi:aryl-alcohol dehydrogenase-like predicted oxidoreductase
LNQIFYKDINTSNLGFGTSLLTRNNSVKDAMSNLETAFDAGVTHFDCAKLYGFGQAEMILGRFAKNKRHSISITSKSGLYARKLPLFTLPIVNKIRKIVSHGREAIVTKESSPKYGVFDKDKLKSDIESSLKSIGTDYIDFFMLHEASVSSANRTDLIEVLQNAQSAGKIRHFGVATHYLNLKNDIYSLNQCYDVIQHNYPLKFGNSFMEVKDTAERFRIIYSIFSELSQINISKVYYDLGYQNAIEYILSHYYKLNSSGITLFSSVSNKRIIETAKLWSDMNKNLD